MTTSKINCPDNDFGASRRLGFRPATRLDDDGVWEIATKTSSSQSGGCSYRGKRRAACRRTRLNYVVATNTAAVRLWEQLGLRIVGTLPGVFRHAKLGFVDAYTMFRTLEDGI